MRKYIIILIIISLLGCNEEKKVELVKDYIVQIRSGNIEYSESFFDKSRKIDTYGVKTTNIKIKRLLDCSKDQTYQIKKDQFGTIIEIIVLLNCKQAILSQNESIGKISFRFSAYPNKRKLTSVITNLVAFPSDWDK